MRPTLCGAVAVLALISSHASAQELPALDPRILTLSEDAHGILAVSTQPGLTQTVLFQPGGRIVSVVLSDPSAFEVHVAARGDSLTLEATRPSAFGLMTVRTPSRTYVFQLTARANGAASAVVRLAAPTAQPSARQRRGPVQAPVKAQFGYRLSGDKALRPTSIRDDGAKTYIEWGGERAMPATFAEGPTGDEQMVDGYMRGNVYVIDRVYQDLIFRIDKKSATARRNDEADSHE